MPIISFANLGAQGIITDKAANELPLDAWSSGKNVRFSPLGVERALGSRAIFGTPPVEPLQAFQAFIGASPVWVYPSNTKIYATDGTTHANITRQSAGADVDYTTSLVHKWTGGNFNGLVVMNNRYDVPQVWTPTTLATKSLDLANWPATLRANVLRPFGNYLVAMDLTLSGVSKPGALRWSHPAEPGTVPISWDIADTTKDAGEIYFNETSGAIKDLVSLRNDAIIYKSDAVYGMQYVGGVFIFKTRKLATQVGTPAPRCALEVKPGLHMIWTGEDVLAFDGQQFTSIAANKIQGHVRNISDSTYQSVFMVWNPSRSEGWICWPEDESKPHKATKAFVFNWLTGAWGYKDLPDGYNFIAMGMINPDPVSTTDTWVTDEGPWDSDTFAWGESVVARATTRLLGCKASALTYEDNLTTTNDQPYESMVERVAFGIPFKQDRPPDITSWKFCREIWPRVTGDPGTILLITLGSMSEVAGTVNWGEEQTFIVGVDTKVNCTVSARMFAIRFRSVGVGNWTLHGYDLNVSFSGGY